VTVLLLGVIPVFLTACKKDDDGGYVFVPVAAHTDCTAIFDPKLDGDPKADITYAIEPAGYTYTVDVKIMDGASEVRLLVDGASQAGEYNYTTQWDGKNESGKFVNPGTYQVVVDAVHSTVTPTTHQADINVVRLGVDEMSFGGYAMVYPKRSSGSTTDYAIGVPQWAIENLDTATGTPRAEAVPNESVMYPDSAGAANHNYPFCYAAGAKVQFTPRLGSQAVSNITQTSVGVNYPVSGCPIRIEATGYSTQDAGAEDISPGDSFDFEADAALAAGCAAEIAAIDFTFSYNDGSGWVAVPGKYSTTHERYRTMGTPKAVDYSGDGSPEGFLYAPIVEWSCTWAAGAWDVKGVADGCYLHLEECGLKYMILAWYTADMLDDGGGMCDGWNDIFDHLLTVHGFSSAKYFYGLSPNAGSSPELKWASIVIKSPGMNRTEPCFTNANNYRCVDFVYPVPRFYGNTDPNDDVDYYQNMHWYKFSSPTTMDGHCINFLDYGGVIYLYDATFRNTLGPYPLPGTFASLPPDGYMQGSELSAFKSIYYNTAIDYHEGDVYCDTGGSTAVATLDIRTSLFGPDELRLYWLKQD
jgi:hypothetical protein